MNGFETILPFLKPIEHLIVDDSISEVMVNGGDCVFFEKNGFLGRSFSRRQISREELRVSELPVVRGVGRLKLDRPLGGGLGFDGLI